MLRTPERDVHIHVFPPDSSEIDRYLCFRNRLRSDATDRRHYEATKGRLAAQDWPDMNAYAEAKGAVVEQIMANGGGTPRTGTAAPATGTAAIAIRPLTSADPAIMAKAFAAIGWNKPQELFERYLAEQDSGKRVIVVAYAQQRFAGYVTLFLRPDYRYLQDRVIPEVRDFNVLPQLRHRGIGAALMDAIEAEAARHSDLLGISVGLHADYGAAQRMYVQRGYVPDGRGLIHAGRVVAFNVPVPNDDDLVIAFTKRLR